MRSEIDVRSNHSRVPDPGVQSCRHAEPAFTTPAPQRRPSRRSAQLLRRHAAGLAPMADRRGVREDDPSSEIRSFQLIRSVTVAGICPSSGSNVRFAFVPLPVRAGSCCSVRSIVPPIHFYRARCFLSSLFVFLADPGHCFRVGPIIVVSSLFVLDTVPWGSLPLAGSSASGWVACNAVAA